MSSGGPPFVDFPLPGMNIWIPIEKTFFLFGAERAILLNRESPVVSTRHYFSLPPFTLNSSARPNLINGIIMLPLYNELWVSSPLPIVIRYVLGNAKSPDIPFP